MRIENMSYRIIRFHQNIDKPPVTIKEGLSLEEAKEHCNDPETSSRTCTEFGPRNYTHQHGPWFDGYEEE